MAEKKQPAKHAPKIPATLKGAKSPLSKAELREFREMLIAKRRSLMGDMSGIQAEAFKKNREGTGDLSNMPTHPADIGTDNFEQEFTLGLLESERVLLREIDEALERMDAGVYGICLGTGQPIGASRLKARPWAKYCIEYARLIEKGLVKPESEQQEEQIQQGEAGNEEIEDEEEEEHEEVEDREEREEAVEDDEE